MALTTRIDKYGTTRHRAYCKLNGVPKQKYFRDTPEEYEKAVALQKEYDQLVRMITGQRRRRIFGDNDKILGLTIVYKVRPGRQDEINFNVQKQHEKVTYKKTYAMFNDKRTFNEAYKLACGFIFDNILNLLPSDRAAIVKELEVARRLYMREYQAILSSVS